MKIIRSTEIHFLKEFQRIENRSDAGGKSVERDVKTILNRVKKGGDNELLRLTKKFDKVNLSKKRLRVTKGEIDRAIKKVPGDLISHLKFAAQKIKKFHKRQMEKSWKFTENGVTLGQIIRPVEKAGIYAPGGKGAYPSSVLMNAIPAKVAGVKRVILCSPATGGEMNPVILAAARIAGVDEVFALGGAQAIGALAYGTETVPKVDKITGPGNIYVAEAKRQVFGTVDIDMIAGPSEILIIADAQARPDFIAADLISQAEHDELAYPILITTSEKLAKDVFVELKTQTARLSRGGIIKKSLRKNCRAFVVKNMKEAVDLANRCAPEHLEIMAKNAEGILKDVKNAGAIFLGNYTPEAVGDYAAGPNHVLPTGGSARFFSPLGVYDFLKRTSLISFSQKSLKKIGKPVMEIAEAEGFSGHAEAVRIRLK